MTKDQLITEMQFLRRIIFFQQAEIRGLRAYLLSQSTDIKSAAETIQKLIQHEYDKEISKIEDNNPAYAASIDARPYLSEDRQLQWYFPQPPKSSEG
jgi:hypothetical protein